MASNTDVVKKKLYHNISVLCLYLCVCYKQRPLYMKNRFSKFP